MEQILQIENSQSHFLELRNFIQKGKSIVDIILNSCETYLDESDIEIIRGIDHRLQCIQDQILHSENLSDEDKENIVIGYKEKTDKILRSLKECWCKLCAVFEEKCGQILEIGEEFFNDIVVSIIEQLSFEYDTILNEFKRYEPLQLTNEELYFGFTFLNNEQIRIILTEQSHKNFNKIYSAYQKGIKYFLEVLEDLDYLPSIGLRVVLSAAINDVYPFQSWQVSNIKIDSSIGGYLSYELFGEQTTNILREIKKSGPSALSIDNLLEDFNRFHQIEVSLRPIVDQLVGLFNNEEYIDNKSDKSIDLNISDSVGLYSDRAGRIVISIIDNWIRWAINERREHSKNMIESTESVKVDSSVGNTTVSTNTVRLEFPTRITNNKNMELNIKKQILEGLFNAFGHNFENMDGNLISKEGFMYLFNGPMVRPANYSTPYYWNGKDLQFAGLLRLLYLAQPSGVDYIIHPAINKGKVKSSVKWSAKKQGLGTETLRTIEVLIQQVVFSATGKYLPEVDLTKQNKPKKKKVSKDVKAKS